MGPVSRRIRHRDRLAYLGRTILKERSEERHLSGFGEACGGSRKDAVSVGCPRLIHAHEAIDESQSCKLRLGTFAHSSLWHTADIAGATACWTSGDGSHPDPV